MRVVAGELKGRRLASPPRRSAAVRPTADRVREALFSILGDVAGAAVLDLFCGTGALGDRGALAGRRGATLVDTRTSLARRNVARARARRSAARSSAPTRCATCAARDARFDLIFCDPPYRLADRLEGELDSLIPETAREGRALDHRERRPAAARARACRCCPSGGTATP